MYLLWVNAWNQPLFVFCMNGTFSFNWGRCNLSDIVDREAAFLLLYAIRFDQHYNLPFWDLKGK